MSSLDLGIVGNSNVSALVTAAGEICWTCLPRVDGDPVFCSLLREGTDQEDHGFLAVELAREVGPAGCVVAADTSAEMVAAARERARREGVERRIAVACADAAALSGDPAAAVVLAREALQLVDAGKDARRAAGLQERLRWYLWEAGDREAAELALDEAVRLVPKDPPSAARARVLAHLGGLRLRQGRLAESLAFADEAIEVARGSGALAELAFALGVRAWDRAGLGRPSEGLVDVREAVAITELLERPEGRALGVTNLSSLLSYVGRLDEAIEEARAGLAIVRSVGLEGVYAGTLAATAGAACFRLGRWHEARDLSRTALAAVPPGPDAVWVGAAAIRLGAAIGDHALIRSGLAVGQPVVAEVTDQVHRGWYRVALIEMDLAEDRLEAAQIGATVGLADSLPTVLDDAAGTITALALRIAAERAEIARATAEDPELEGQRAIADTILAGWRQRRKRTHRSKEVRP